MPPNTPSAAPEASSEVLRTAAPTEGSVTPEAQREGQVRAVDKRIAEVDDRVRAARVDAEATSTAPAGTGDAAPETDTGSKAGFFAGSLSWLSKQFESVSKFFTETGSTFWNWLKKIMGIKGKDPTDQVASAEQEAEPAEPESDEPEISTEVEGEDLLTPEDATGLLEVKSWDEVMAISDLPMRVLQAALYANATNMDCFVKNKKGELENHCSAWCESVFQKAGLKLYDDKSRIYCDGYEGWGKKGTLDGLELQPGDSIIRHNGNASTGNHQEIILSSDGPGEDGKYQVLTVGQTSVRGKSGVRKIRSMVIDSKDIKVVIRPGATHPFDGVGPLVG